LVAGQAQQGAPMTDVASALRAAAECLWYPLGRWEIDEGFKWAEAAIAALPPDLAARVESALVCNDCDMRVKALEDLADALGQAGFQESISVRAESAKPRRQRKPSLRTLIAQAEKSGKSVSSITTPEGTKLTFGEPESEIRNELDEWIAKRAH
jgi:hypothetical protein